MIIYSRLGDAMKKRTDADRANERTVTKLMFRLLPIQILIAVIASLNSIISALFASNFIDINAMSAVGLYAPIQMLLTSINMAFTGGATILCGQYMGKNESHKMRGIFSLDMAASFFIGLFFAGALFCAGKLVAAGFFLSDQSLRPEFSVYLIGQAIGVIPFMLGGQLSSFLSLENKMRRNTVASLSFIATNVFLNFLFIQKMKMGVWGLSLAASLGAWVYFFVQAQYFFTKKSRLRFSPKDIDVKDLSKIFLVGYPGALSNCWQTLRGFIVNFLLSTYVGTVGISAFCASNTLMAVIWCIPLGMVTVSRMVMSVGVGEEDRTCVANVMRVMFKKFCLVNLFIGALIVVFAKQMAYIFYQDIFSQVYIMTTWGFRIFPICLMLGSIFQHFVCYAQMSGKNFLIQLTSFFDGVFFVSGFSAILVPFVGVNGVYIANVLNGIFVFVTIVVYSIFCNRKFPRNMEELMVMPDSFGVPQSQRLDFSVRNMQDVLELSKTAQNFCLERSVDSKRAYYASLALEEMAGNVVAHGFNKDKKKHSVEVRVVQKDQDLFLRVRDDCVAFNPEDRLNADVSGDPAKNIGIKMVYRLAKSASWQSIFGMNVLTVKI